MYMNVYEYFVTFVLALQWHLWQSPHVPEAHAEECSSNTRASVGKTNLSNSVMCTKCLYSTRSVKTCYRCAPSDKGDAPWLNWRVPMQHETFLQTRADTWPWQVKLHFIKAQDIWVKNRYWSIKVSDKSMRFLSASVSSSPLAPTATKKAEREALDEKCAQRWLDSCASCCIWLDWAVACIADTKTNTEKYAHLG